jgi:hypothetical protein
MEDNKFYAKNRHAKQAPVKAVRKEDKPVDKKFDTIPKIEVKLNDIHNSVLLVSPGTDIEKVKKAYLDRMKLKKIKW